MATLAQELATIETELAATRTAIAAVQSGAQSYTDNDGQTILYASLRDLSDREVGLMKRQHELELKIERQSSGPLKVAEF